MKSFAFASLATSVLAGCAFDTSGSALGDGGGITADSRLADAATIDAAVLDAEPLDAEPLDAEPLDAEPPDAMGPVITDDVAHVPVAAEFGGASATADLTLTTVAIDTTALTISGVTLPTGVTFASSPQDGGGPDLAILHVDDLTLSGTIRVTGTRPFVVVASGTIINNAAIDAGGRRNAPGAGGAVPGAGPAPGLSGTHAGTWADSGGGGGGYATAGGQGGDAFCTACTDPVGGLGGGVIDDATIPTLRGGSGGGAAAASTGCVFPVPGGGGGAVQLYAAISILQAGTIHTGGGGGGQGEQCTNYSSASGGGSGGAIYLQTPALTISGALYANGGGGGGSAGDTSDGGFGLDGGAGTSTLHGANGGPYGRDGGDGGGSAAAAQPGVDGPNNGNGGGGGGAAGRIAVRTKGPILGTVMASPTANTATY